MLSSDRVDPGVVVAGLLADLRAARRFDIGFPGATDLHYPQLAEVLTSRLLNNIGDPWEAGHGRNHTKVFEQHVVDTVADHLRAPAARWGYVTTGSTEATIHAMDEGARAYPDAVVYTSSAAHYSVAKAAALLRLPLVTVAAHRDGRLDPADLRDQLSPRRHRPALVVATAGTTMSEAVDDVDAVRQVCQELRVTRRRIHVDAALSGIPLALLPERERPAFDFSAGATSMGISGHKFLSTLMPCGVLVYAGTPDVRGGSRAYTGSADTTGVSSRSGHTPLLLWWVLTTLGTDGLRRRATASRELAAYTHARLQQLGWPSARNPHAFTVTLRRPPPQVLAKWVLAVEGDVAHVVCMPGVERAQLDEFVADLAPHVSALGQGSRAAVQCSASTTT